MDSKEPKIKELWESRFGWNIFLFRLAGIPFKFKKISTIYSVYMRTVIVCSCITFVGMFADVYVHRDDLGHAMTTMRVLIPVTNIMWIYIYCRLRQQSIERAIELTDSFTWEDLPIRDADTGYLTLAGWIPLIKLFSTRTAMALPLFHVIQSTIRIATNHETIYNTWYPFDWTISPFYELVNISQCFATLVALGVVYGYISLVTTLIAVACTQFEKLKAAILDIRENHITPHHWQEDEQVHINCDFQAKLNACIRHHQNIMRFMQQIEDALNVSLCGHFLILLLAMCFAAFSIVTNWGDYADMSQALFIYVSYTSDVLLICWFGTQLTEHAESVRDAAFGCDWVGSPIPFQRSLNFVMAAANKQFQLTAGKFVPVSNVTTLNINRSERMCLDAETENFTSGSAENANERRLQKTDNDMEYERNEDLSESDGLESPK